MLGTGGASLLVSSTAAAGPVVPLFSGRESAIWTPEHTSLTGGHLVLTRPSQVPWQHAATPPGADPNVLRVNRTLWPKIGGETLRHLDDPRGWSEYGTVNNARDLESPGHMPNVPDLKVVVGDGDDLHEAFYRATTWMRDSFAKQSQQRLLEISQVRRRAYQLVTLVDVPMFAGVLKGEDEGRGFLLHISYTPYLVLTGETELNGWTVYSENGEYPIEIPTDIDMDQLRRVDRLVVRGDASPSRMGGRLILPLGSSPA